MGEFIEDRVEHYQRRIQELEGALEMIHPWATYGNVDKRNRADAIEALLTIGRITTKALGGEKRNE